MSVELCGMANRVPDPFRARKELDEVPSPQGPPHSRLRRAVQPSCQAQALLIGRQNLLRQGALLYHHAVNLGAIKGGIKDNVTVFSRLVDENRDVEVPLLRQGPGSCNKQVRVAREPAGTIHGSNESDELSYYVELLYGHWGCRQGHPCPGQRKPDRGAAAPHGSGGGRRSRRERLGWQGERLGTKHGTVSERPTILNHCRSAASSGMAVRTPPRASCRKRSLLSRSSCRKGSSAVSGVA